MSNYRLLIVDDNLERANRLLDLLKQRNFEVTYVPKGNKALQEVRDDGYDLILTNILLDDMDSVELVSAIQEVRPDLPVVIMSSQTQASKTIKALYAGAHHFIREPYEFDEVIKTIEKLLKSCQQDIVSQKILPFLDERLTFCFPSDLSAMGPIAQYITNVLVRMGLLKADDIHLKIALLEAITNAIEHGNKQDPSKTVEIHAELNAHKAVFSVKDQGAGFDYQNLPDPTEPKNLIKVRGRGVFLIHKIMDEVYFNENGSEITMVRHFNNKL